MVGSVMIEIDSLSTLLEPYQHKIQSCESLEQLEELRIEILGKNGFITQRLKALGQLDPDQRRQQGAVLNQAKDRLLESFHTQKQILESKTLHQRLAKEEVDVTLPARPAKIGKIHLLTQVKEQILSHFQRIGFQVVEGREIEDEYHNFDALNIPAHHPARQNHDTFYLKNWPQLLLRTHTSTVQIRSLAQQKPPLRLISMGRVYRSDHLAATHTPMFHQLEGLVLESGIHMGHLKGCLIDFCRDFFQMDTLPVRFRPSFFPFTEPSLEVDIRHPQGTSDQRWLEILGAGMVHPQVLRNCGIDPETTQGFAFGMGLERLVMLKYGLDDIRPLYTSDQRWLDYYGRRYV